MNLACLRAGRPFISLHQPQSVDFLPLSGVSRRQWAHFFTITREIHLHRATGGRRLCDSSLPATLAESIAFSEFLCAVKKVTWSGVTLFTCWDHWAFIDASHRKVLLFIRENSGRATCCFSPMTCSENMILGVWECVFPPTAFVSCLCCVQSFIWQQGSEGLSMAWDKNCKWG